MRGRQHDDFVAIPVGRLEIFGTPAPQSDGKVKHRPFHSYTLKQAIQEGFILDVLEHYTTYRTYFRIEKAIRDDPEYDEKKAKAAIARYLTLHPHNLAQKAEIIVEQLGVDEADIKPEASFVDDLNADSLDLVELVMSLEEEFGTEISDEDAEKIRTVQDAVDYIDEHLNQ